MNQKGFTLVELMGILVILGVIIVFTVPSITKTLKNSETNELKEYQNTICLAAKSYVEIEDKGFPENNITFSTLRSKGYLSSSLKNPKTNSLDSGSRTVSIKIEDGKEVCSFSS